MACVRNWNCNIFKFAGSAYLSKLDFTQLFFFERAQQTNFSIDTWYKGKGKNSIQPCTTEIHLEKICHRLDHHLWILSVSLIRIFLMGNYLTLFNTNKLLFT